MSPVPTHSEGQVPHDKEFYVKGRVLIGGDHPAATKDLPVRRQTPTLAEFGERLAAVKRKLDEIAAQVRRQ